MNNVAGTILVNYTGRNGGGPIFAFEMTHGLLENGADVVAVISSGIDNLDDWKNLPLKELIVIDTYSNKFNYVSHTMFFCLDVAKQIKKRLSRYRFSAIYCPMVCPWTKRINELFPSVPAYVTLHDPLPHSGEKWYLKRQKLSFNTEKLIVLSRQFIEEVEKKYNKPVIWIPHGRFDYYKKKYFTGYRSSETINYLFFGRIEEYKGLDVLAQAFSLIGNNLKNQYTLTVAGRGDWSKYEKYFENIENLYVVNKWLDDKEINDLFVKEKTVLILPYIDATQSGVIPIAQEYYVPVIASDAGGLKEQIVDGETGLLFARGDGSALGMRIKAIDDNWEFAKKLADNAYQKLEEISWLKLSKKLMENI